MSGWKRKRVTIDFPVQGSLCFRIACYWGSCLCIVGVISAMRLSIVDSEFARDWAMEYGRLLLLSLIALPLALLDGLVFSNRFSGPMYRIRTELKNLAEGKPAEKVLLRPNDYYADVAEDLNALIDRLDGNRQNPCEANASDDQADSHQADSHQDDETPQYLSNEPALQATVVVK